MSKFAPAVTPSSRVSKSCSTRPAAWSGSARSTAPKRADSVETRLRQALARAEEVARQLADPDTARNPAKLKQLGREHAQLDAIRQTHQRMERLESELEQAREVLADKDPELSQLARADVERVRPELQRLEAELAELLVPADPFDDRDAIVEIRAGTGGDEAALFPADLFRMYTCSCGWRGRKVEILSLSARTRGRLREARSS